MSARILILGGGVGGTIVANRLARQVHHGDAEIIVADATGRHVYQPGLLYLPFSERGNSGRLARSVRQLLDRRVQFIQATAGAIDPKRHTVQVDGSLLAFDFLVLATGARLAPEKVPGFNNAHHFYDLESAVRLRGELAQFNSGRIVVGPSRKLFKCPPAPLEFILLLDDYLRRRRIRDRIELHYVYPFAEVFHFKPIARIISPLLQRRGIQATTNFNVKDIGNHTLRSHEGVDVPFDLAVIIPPHRVAPAIEKAGLAAEGWVSVDPNTLQVKEQENIYALGDVTDLPIPKTGAVARFQATSVVEGILAHLRGVGHARSYDGRGLCWIETGAGRATTMRFDYHRTAPPSGPSRVFHWAKTLLNRFYWLTIPSGRF